MECHQNDDVLVIGYRPQSVANVLSVYLLSIFSFYIFMSCETCFCFLFSDDDDDDVLKTSARSVFFDAKFLMLSGNVVNVHHL